MKPLDYYQQLITTNAYLPDVAQQEVIAELERIYQAVITAQSRWRCLSFRRKKPIQGLYLWGGVGMGKTWLMDILYHCLPRALTTRVHLHRFMQQTHMALTQLQGKKDPLKIVAKQFAKTKKVLCFDEFVVNDITDAMLLAGLLQALFSQGVILIATSNLAPKDLYKHGIQRERFLPAIDLIQQHTTVMQLASQCDYRLRELAQAGTYYFPLTNDTQKKMQAWFARLADSEQTQGEPLQVSGRAILTRRLSSNIVWFDFGDLCHVPRSQLDYLEIAQSFHTVLLSNVPKIEKHQDNIVRYLINLVDVFYDAKVKLIVAAAVPLPAIYPEGRLAFEFQRTLSRLQEMQSEAYWQTPHLG